MGTIKFETTAFEPTVTKTTKFYAVDSLDVANNASVTISPAATLDSVVMYANETNTDASAADARSYELYVDVVTTGSGEETDPVIVTRLAKTTKDDTITAGSGYDLYISAETAIVKGTTKVDDVSLTVKNISGVAADIRLVVVGEI